MRAHRWSVLLTGWTFLVWTTRISNIWNDADLTTGEKWGRTGLAGSFTVLALAVAFALIRRARWLPWAVALLAGWTTAVWVVRATRIALADHDLGFILVHVVLAVVSIVLSALAWREVSSASRRVPA